MSSRVSHREAAANARDEGPASRATRLPAEDVLPLQRAAGNRAFAFWLARQRMDAGVTATGRAPPRSGRGIDAGGPSDAVAPRPAGVATGASRLPPVSGPEFTNESQLVANLNAIGPDLRRAYHFLNGRSMADMIRILRRLIPSGAIEHLRTNLDRADDVNVARIRLGIAAATATRTGRVLFDLQHGAELAGLSDVEREGVLSAIGPRSDEVEAIRRHRALQNLPWQERNRFQLLIGGTTTVSRGALQAFQALHANLDDPETYRRFLRTYQAPLAVTPLAAAPSAGQAPATLEGPTPVSNYRFDSGTANANRYTLHVRAAGGRPQDITIFAPATWPPANVGVLPSVNDVVTSLRSLPDLGRRQIREVQLNPSPNPQDVIWQHTPGYSPTHVSFMTSGSDRIVRIFPQPVTLSAPVSTESIRTGSMLHEAGHVISESAWGRDSHGARWRRWRNAMASDRLTVSRYARASPADDFAETWAVYIPIRSAPAGEEVRALLPARCRLLDELLR